MMLRSLKNILSIRSGLGAYERIGREVKTRISVCTLIFIIHIQLQTSPTCGSEGALHVPHQNLGQIWQRDEAAAAGGGLSPLCPTL